MPRRDSGRIGVARKILLDAAQKAMETGEYIISLKCRSKSDAFNIRQSCYTFQRSWAAAVEEQAILDGKDPTIVLNETVMKASWPSASIRYEFIEGNHWLLFEFKRIATDPNWDELLKERLVAGPPPRAPKPPPPPVEQQLNSDEVYRIISEIEP